MKATIIAIAVALFEKLLAAIFGSRQDARERAETNATHERLGATESGHETQQVIAETAAARADLSPDPDSPDALVAELRSRADRKRAANGLDTSATKLTPSGAKGSNKG